MSCMNFIQYQLKFDFSKMYGFQKLGIDGVFSDTQICMVIALIVE